MAITTSRKNGSPIRHRNRPVKRRRTSRPLLFRDRGQEGDGHREREGGPVAMEVVLQPPAIELEGLGQIPGQRSRGSIGKALTSPERRTKGTAHHQNLPPDV